MDRCLGFLMDGTSANRKALRKLEVGWARVVCDCDGS
jgi:hypothetical protein